MYRRIHFCALRTGIVGPLLAAFAVASACVEPINTKTPRGDDPAVGGGGAGGSGGSGGEAPVPEYETIVCEGAPSASPGAAVCEVTAGDARVLIVGDVLTPDVVYEQGAVLVDNGTIACVGCDCLAEAEGATQVICPEAVVSPGLINAHDHAGWMNGEPWVATAAGVDPSLRWEHRNDWRTGKRGNPEISEPGGSATNEDKIYGELRFVLSGATSLFGSTDLSGLLRDLDNTGEGESGLMSPGAKFDTFPLGDTSGTQMESGCTSYDIDGPAAEFYDCHAPHVAEGIDTVSRNEFMCLTGQGAGSQAVLDGRSALIHGIGLTPAEYGAMAAEGMRLIWSPRSNISLYGDTALVTVADRLGISIGLGTDWLPSGSMNMLRELACAASFNDTALGGYFSDRKLWRMATLGSAEALAFDDEIGVLSEGHVADIAVYALDGNEHFSAVVRADVADVALVMRGGQVLSGNASVVSALESECEPLDVCGVEKQVCVARDTGSTLAEVEASIDAAYPLFFCDVPENEPSCLPARTLPSDSVDGSTMYGVSSGSDPDGDGLDDVNDNCPNVFNPVRPVDGGSQGDYDLDSVGDVCDVCPLEADVEDCAPAGPGPDPEPGPDPVALTIFALQDPSDPDHPSDGARVEVECTVTAVGPYDLWCQDVAGGPMSGIAVHVSSAPTYPDDTAVMVGDNVRIVGDYKEFYDLTELIEPELTFLGVGTVPTPVVLAAADIANGGSLAEDYEGVLVRVESVSVTVVNPDAPSDYDEFVVTGGLRIDDAAADGGGMGGTIDNTYPISTAFTSIVGVHHYGFSNFKLLPRSLGDLSQ